VKVAAQSVHETPVHETPRNSAPFRLLSSELVIGVTLFGNSFVKALPVIHTDIAGVKRATRMTRMLTIAVLLTASLSAWGQKSCALPVYLDVAHSTAHNSDDTTGKLFVYRLQTLLQAKGGCLATTRSDAHIILVISTVKIVNTAGPSESSVIAVTLNLPMDAMQIYLDSYVLIVQDAAGVDGQVDTLVNLIGSSLDALDKNADRK
jgi:hypothetical protein